MKVLVDVLTPKQCMLFAELSERLRRDGHQVTLVTREYREVNQLLMIKGMTAQVLGKHGGGNLRDKLRASVQRTLELTSFAAEVQPDVAVSLASPETSRVAFGLGIPHVCLNDSPHSEAVARLTVPLVTLLVTPKFIPKNAWTKFGAKEDAIIQYNAIDPWIWLKDFRPNNKILKQLGLETTKPIVVFRAEESFASYLLGVAAKSPSWILLLESLLRSGSSFQAVIIPRYDAQIAYLTKRLKNRVVICKSVIDAASLLAYTSIFVGAGGTMTAEAALLGVPTFSCYPGKPFLIEEFLIRKRLVTREADWHKAKTRILKILKHLNSSRKVQLTRAKKLTNSFEDPIEVIVEAVERFS